MLLLDTLAVVMEAIVQDFHQRVTANLTVLISLTVVMTSTCYAVSPHMHSV